MANIKPAVVGVLIVLGLGVGFGGGYFFRNHQLTKTPGNFQRFNGANRPGGNQVGTMRGGIITGSVLSMDDKSITVKLTDGSSKIILFSDSTTYSNTISSANTDLKIGGDVAIVGTTNSDGSITATNVQINPQFGRMITSPSPASK